MRKAEFGLSPDNAEVITLVEKAKRLLGSPKGQKILREIAAFDALAHSDKGWIEPPGGGKSYNTNEYKQPIFNRFSITKFYPGVYFVKDDLLLTPDNAFTHRTRLESQIAEDMPELYTRLQNPETRVILGDTFKVRGTDVQFFAIRGESGLHLEEIRTITARQLAKHGILLLFWGNDTEWEEEQLKKPEFARYADYKRRCDEARSRAQLFAEWGDILDAFGGHAPIGPEKRYKWTIISPT